MFCYINNKQSCYQLKERGEDIILLADYFLKRFSGEVGRNGMFFAPEVLDIFRNYSWPGNIRELENADLVEFFVVFRMPEIIPIILV